VIVLVLCILYILVDIYVYYPRQSLHLLCWYQCTKSQIATFVVKVCSCIGTWNWYWICLCDLVKV